MAMNQQQIESVATEMTRVGWDVPRDGETACMGSLYRTPDAALVACVHAWLSPYGEPADLSDIGVTEVSDDDMLAIGMAAREFQGEVEE